MTRSVLSRIFRRPVEPPRTDHRDALGERLLSRYDATVGQVRRPRVGWVRFAAPSLVLVSLVTASRVPAEYLVEVGKRVTLQVTSMKDLPAGSGERIADLVRDEKSRILDAKVVLRHRTEGGAVLIVDVWGERLADDDTVRQRLSSLAGLADADFQVETLQGRVRDSLLDRVGHALFRVGASPAERESARKELIERLRREEGEGAEVTVEEGEGGKVRVRVLKKAPAP